MSNQEWIFGFNAISDLIQSDANQVIEILLDQTRRDQRVQSLIELAKKSRLTVHRVDKGVLEKRFEGQRHQGVAACVKPIGLLDETGLMQLIENLDQPLLLMLDHIQDPRNYGACLRSAAAAGVDAVIVPKDRSASLTAVARNAASGAASRVPIASVTNLSRTLDALKKQNIWAVASTGEASQS